MATKSQTSRSMGRPPISKHSLRSKRIVTLLTADEYTALTRNAAEASMSISTYSHTLIIEGLSRHGGAGSKRDKEDKRL